MGVDILPTELSVESSKHFGEALMPLLRQLISGGFSKDDDVYGKLPPELVSHCLALFIGQCCTHFYYFSFNMSRFCTLCSGKCMYHAERFSHSKLSVH